MKKREKEKKVFLVQLKTGGHFNRISVLYGDRWKYKETGCKTDRQTTHRTKHLKKH